MPKSYHLARLSILFHGVCLFSCLQLLLIKYPAQGTIIEISFIQGVKTFLFKLIINGVSLIRTLNFWLAVFIIDFEWLNPYLLLFQGVSVHLQHENQNTTFLFKCLVQ